MQDNDLERGGRKARSGRGARKTNKRPAPIRASRMAVEELERRDMMAPLGGAPEQASSDVLNGSMISAYFEQSAMYFVRAPVAFPNVDWISHLEPSHVDARGIELEEQIARIGEIVDMELMERESDRYHLKLPADVGGRTASGARRLLRLHTEWPDHVFAPTIDMSESPLADFPRIARTEGILFFDLAYITADEHNRPSWCGMEHRGVDGGPFDAGLREKIHDLRALGGDVVVSFAGPAGKSLAEAITNTKALKNAYRRVVDAYAVSRINFDLDGAALDDQAAVERRWQAVSALQREMADAGLPLEVWVTLTASEGGLSPQGLDAVRSAAEHGVHLDGVNLKTDADGKTLPEVGTRAFDQLSQRLGPDAAFTWSEMGITPAIGPEAGGAPFTAKDAKELYDFATRHGIGVLGAWQQKNNVQDSGEPKSQGGSTAVSQADTAEIMEIFGDFGDEL